eukprot:346364-Rhodomonas_salina.1
MLVKGVGGIGPLNESVLRVSSVSRGRTPLNGTCTPIDAGTVSTSRVPGSTGYPGVDTKNVKVFWGQASVQEATIGTPVPLSIELTAVPWLTKSGRDTVTLSNTDSPMLVTNDTVMFVSAST